MNYKETLNLPKTEFPMKASLTAREPKILEKWANIYQQVQESRENKPVFVLHDGPPFANGDVHMGTGLNKILKDFIVKSRTMAGFKCPYIPGWDCHGLPIEFKVVKESGGLSPLEVRQRSEAYARKFIDIQRNQFKRLGIFGDWDHPYLTMDPAYEAEVLRVFAEIVAKDLVYQSRKPVFWSTGAQTALAEAEIEYKDRTDPSIYVGFPLVTGRYAGKAAVAIWTTTPWTLPANLAVAVHPKFDYIIQSFKHPDFSGSRRLLLAKKLQESFSENTGWLPNGAPETELKGAELISWRYQHPFLDRQSSILPGEFVTLDAGTGCVHSAPGHGADDYVMGIQNSLPPLSPVDDNGRYTAEVGIPEWVGKYVFDANPDVIALLKTRDALLGHHEYRHSYPHCWRSKTPIIFRAVEQFFIRVDQIKQNTLEAIDQVQWLPHWGRNRIYSTVESRLDWCISRQRTWGIPLPVFYSGDQPILNPDWIRKVADLVEKEGSNAWYRLGDRELCEKIGLPNDLNRRNDTLDVWIDSGCSHQAVLRTHPELRWPADVYIEATDQHRGWFQSSLLTSVAVHGKAPYKEVITHAFVVDIDSREKLSKSQQGNYSKPTEAEFFVKKYGADIVRLWVASVNYADEVPFGEKMFDQLTDTYRRIRNTLRILLANLYDFDLSKHQTSELPLVDRWIQSRLNQTIAQCLSAYDTFEFHKVYHTINQFCAIDLSSLYVDITKDRMYCDTPDSSRRRATQTVMHQIFDSLVRLLAPLLAFTAEEAWGYFGKQQSVHMETFPQPGDIDQESLEAIEALLSARAAMGQAVESARQQKLVGNTLEARIDLTLPADHLIHRLNLTDIEEFLILSELHLHIGELSATAQRTQHHRCERCWRHRSTVGTIESHPQLCDRCADVVERM
jgi:isoleucyl-tRNA synthetase